jgi:predicted nucleic acid-binding protein
MVIEGHPLAGRGIGYLDAHLPAAARLSGSRLWTLDRRLADLAAERGVAWDQRLA